MKKDIAIPLGKLPRPFANMVAGLIQDHAGTTIAQLESQLEQLEHIANSSVLANCKVAQMSLAAGIASIAVAHHSLIDMYNLEQVPEEVEAEYVDSSPEFPPESKKRKVKKVSKKLAPAQRRLKAAKTIKVAKAPKMYRTPDEWRKAYREGLPDDVKEITPAEFHQKMMAKLHISKSASYNALYAAVKNGIVKRHKNGKLSLVKAPELKAA